MTSHTLTLPGSGSIASVRGIRVGHHTDRRRATGCTVIIADAGETDLLAPCNLVDRVHAIMLAGGSAFGLDSASGAMRYLEERGIGIDVGVAKVPIVPAAVLFDLDSGDPRIRPDADAGYQACVAASANPPAEGSVGAGAGATVGKLFGRQRAMKGGLGSAALTVDGLTVGAIVPVNAVGDVTDPATGRVLAGARSADGGSLLDTRAALLAGELPVAPLEGTATTIGCVATDAVLTKAQAQRIARQAHDGLARTINPVHTSYDGDTLFALGTGAAERPGNLLLLGVLAAEVVAIAVQRAVMIANANNLRLY